jgi:hypothetical protein
MQGVEPSPSISPRAPEPAPALAPSLSLLSDLGVVDMELLHHYTISTCYTLSRARAVQAVWRDQVPRIAFTMKPLLHIILAISAMHISRSDSSQRVTYLAHALRHHDTAISTVNPMMQSLADKQPSALFLFCAITSIFACAKPPEESSFLMLFEHGHISEWVRFVRGVKTISDFSKEDLQSGPQAPIMIYGSFLSATRKEPRVLGQGQMFVWELRQLACKVCAGDLVLLQIYQDTLDQLARTLAIVMVPGDQWKLEPSDVLSWPMEMSDEYLTLLQQGAPLALIIFAYFSVSIRQIEWAWWMEGLSERLIAQIHSNLDAEYHSWLRWPQEQIGWTPLSSA